jgi:ABC-2 type transport system ATP-binding protein
MIEVRDLRMNYGETVALHGISTSISRGEVVGLLGPNGAGKTTTMKILVGYLVPTDGGATVAGHDVVEEPLEVQRRVGYLPENAPVYPDMLVQEYMRYIAEMRGLDRGTSLSRIRAAVDECAIGDVLVRPIGHLSKGYRQRVGLAAAILHDPEILILDEPTNGLDPNQIAEVRQLIRRMGETKTVIVSTHILPEVEATCGRAIILIDGRIRADGSLEELTRSRTQVVSVAPGDPAEAARLFESIPGVDALEREEGDGRFQTYRLHLSGDQEVAESVAQAVREKGWPLRELRRDDKTLEQVFRELTESGAEVAA